MSDYIENKNPKKTSEDEILDANFLPADHKLLQKMQKTLETQLKSEQERVNLEFNQKTKILTQLEEKKETIGVQLYESQQKLVELQKLLEQKHELHKDQIEIREKNDSSVIQLDQQVQELQDEVNQLNSQLMKRIDELSKQNLTIKEIELFNESLNSKIKEQRRVTYKIEENIVEKERIKNRQDFRIFNLMEEQKKIKEQKDLLESQVKIQREETLGAKTILQESQEEIDKIISSKKVLCGHLQKASLDLEEKNKTLLLVKEKVSQQLEELMKKENEIIGLHKEIQQYQIQKAKLAEILDKIEKEGKVLDKETEEIDEKMVKTQAKNEQLLLACNSTEEEIKHLELEQSNIKREMNLIEGNIMKFHTEIQQKQEEMLILVSNHKTKEKLHLKLWKQIKKLEANNQEKRLEMENLSNEISRINLDILNTQNQIIMLDETRQVLNKERKEKEDTINKYEIIIRENHDAHERKMNEVAKFNREHDKAKQKMDVIGRGPSEVTLSQLNKEIQNFNKERKRLEGNFIKSQTRAVEKEIYTNNLQNKITYLKRKVAVLEQKKMRLNNEYNGYQVEIKELKQSLKNYEKDMNKLNDFLAVFKEKSIKLNNQTININSEFLEKLTNLEKESVALELDLDKLKQEKAQILDETMECERQILLWERKIELEKEMQETLDPNVGQQEIKSLEKELHLKRLKLNELQKKQEKMMIEIDKVVNKRDNINFKYNSKEMNQNMDINSIQKKPKQENKKSHLAKTIQLFKSSIKQSQVSIQDLQKESNKVEKMNLQIEEEIALKQEQIKQEEQMLNEESERIQKFQFEKLMNVLKVFQNQQKAMCFEKIFKLGKKVPESTKQKEKLMSLKSQNLKFINTMEIFCSENTNYAFLQTFLDQLKPLLNSNQYFKVIIQSNFLNHDKKSLNFFSISLFI